MSIDLEEGDTYQWGDSAYTSPGFFSRLHVDENGCLTANYLLLSDKTNLETKGPFIPNAFTPNHDNLNDVLKIFQMQDDEREVLQFLIFDRWGAMIYNQVGPISHDLISWDGLINGQPAPAGVYIYYLSMVSANKDMTSYKGSVHLIR